jgi:hypothetical protein
MLRHIEEHHVHRIGRRPERLQGGYGQRALVFDGATLKQFGADRKLGLSWNETVTVLEMRTRRTGRVRRIAQTSSALTRRT